jgi:3-methyl-2-oxobutanoate hydroxymethyltransferase
MTQIIRQFSTVARFTANTRLLRMADLKKNKIPITAVTAYSYPQTLHVDRAAVNIILVDQRLSVHEGGQLTSRLTSLRDVIHHSQQVMAAKPNATVVADMPFGSYGSDITSSYNSALRLIKKTGVDAVRIHGTSAFTRDIIRRVVDREIPVIGHISPIFCGDFKSACEVVRHAKELEACNVTAIVVEDVPDEVGRALSQIVSVPIIGINSGNGVDGQLISYHDLVDVTSQDEQSISSKITGKILTYCGDVRGGGYPINGRNSLKQLGGNHYTKFKNEVNLCLQNYSCDINSTPACEYDEELAAKYGK